MYKTGYHATGYYATNYYLRGIVGAITERIRYFTGFITRTLEKEVQK